MFFRQKQQIPVDLAEIVEEARRGKGQLVDVREKSEWQQNHFECAIHLPLSELKRGVGVKTLKKLKKENKIIYLHCRSGNRVRIAQQILARYGCTQVRILPVSMLRMLEKGFKLKQS